MWGEISILRYISSKKGHLGKCFWRIEVLLHASSHNTYNSGAPVGAESAPQSLGSSLGC